jgi:hypothetical protein
MEIYAPHCDGASPKESGEIYLKRHIKPKGAPMPGLVLWKAWFIFGVCCGAVHRSRFPKTSKSVKNANLDIGIGPCAGSRCSLGLEMPS